MWMGSMSPFAMQRNFKAVDSGHESIFGCFYLSDGSGCPQLCSKDFVYMDNYYRFDNRFGSPRGIFFCMLMEKDDCTWQLISKLLHHFRQDEQCSCMSIVSTGMHNAINF